MRAEALTAMQQHCFALADVAEDFSGALDHKNPKVQTSLSDLISMGSAKLHRKKVDLLK